MRPTLAVVGAALVAALAANILGEYELTPVVAVVAGLVVGFVLAELVTTVGQWRGVAAAAIIAVLAAGSILWAGWIDSDEGVEPYPVPAYAGAVVAAVTGAVKARPRSPERA